MSIRNIGYTTLAAVLTAASGFGIAPAQADDTEVFFSITTEEGSKANVLFILDTSQSMYTVEESTPKDPYVAATTYAGACDPTKYYWAASGGSTPDCSGGYAGLSAAQFNCTTWRNEVDANPGGTTKTSRMAQLNPTSGAWVTITAHPSQQAWKMACQVTGSVSPDAPANWGAKSKGKDLYPSGAFTFYKGNWLNWSAMGGGSKYRIDIVREAVGRLITNTSGIRVGLMRYGYDGARDFKQNTATACEVVPDPDEANRSSNGAPIVYPVTDLDGSAVAGFPGADVRAQIRYQLGVDAGNENLGWVVNPSTPDASQPFQIAKGGGSTCPIPLMTPGGRSPIGGGMREAFLYYNGRDWSQKFGQQADLGSTFDYPSVSQSRVDGGDQYQSPIQDNCSKNFIVLLSDGTTEQDNDIDPEVKQLTDPTDGKKLLPKYTGRTDCDTESFLTGTPPPSMCVDDLAEIMYEHDMSSSVDGVNNVITYTVGFKIGPNTDPASASARNLLTETALRGGGSFFEAADAQKLDEALTEIARKILTENTSFSAPAVTVNAFNRTQNLNDLYMALFRPSFDYRWLGNIKKFRIEADGDIVGLPCVNGACTPAVDPGTGFFGTDAWSFWSDDKDGPDVTSGGAAGEIVYGSRNLYTNLTGTSNVTLSADGNSLTDLNDAAYAATAASTLGIGGGDTVTVADLILWAHGKDVADTDADGVTDESRKDMGDPLHGKPLTVIYGGTVANPNLDDALIFAVTNDGFLHAIDPTDGTELWSFIPSNLLDRLRNLYYNQELADPVDRVYGLDGNIRLMRIDNNRNGVIEPANEDGKRDKVYIFFGQRRGGSYYYGLDVTYKDAPKLMWMQSYAAAYGGGQSWSTPTPARVRIGNDVKNVLIMGAGYDPGQDQVPYRQDVFGRGIYMVDALTGGMLWWAGPPASGANLILTGMEYSIPGDIRVIDLTGDGFADRMYAADLGGQLWRFDIVNGKAAGTDSDEGDRLVEGGLLASLGNAPDGSGAASNALRFFYSPDPAIVQYNGSTFINVAIGSGHRENPVSDTTTQNWFFSVRDYLPFGVLLESQYQTGDCADSPCHQTVTEGDLIDLTSSISCDDPDTIVVEPCVPAGAAGWKFELEETGEKSLAESRTFPTVNAFTGAITTTVMFATYSPVETGETEDNCGITFGINKLYAVSAADARPVNNFDKQAGEDVADRSKELESRGTISPEVVLVFPTPDDPNNPQAIPPVCLIGLETCGTSVANPPVRTFWKQRGAN